MTVINFKRITLGLLLMFVNVLVSSGQVDIHKEHSKKDDQILIFFGNSLMFNKANIGNNDIYPNSVQSPHTFIYTPTLGIEYQKTAATGFIYGTGLEYGVFKQQFNIVYNSFDFVDTFDYLKAGSSYGFPRFASKYIGLRVFIGYDFLLHSSFKNSFELETKLTFIKSFLFAGGEYITGGGIAKYVNPPDTATSGMYNVYDIYGRWGNQGNSAVVGPLTAELYMGVKLHVKRTIVNSVNFGILGTRYFRSKSPGEEEADFTVTNGHYLNGSRLTINDTDIYHSLGLSLGLKISVGFKI